MIFKDFDHEMHFEKNLPEDSLRISRVRGGVGQRALADGKCNGPAARIAALLGARSAAERL